MKRVCLLFVVVAAQLAWLGWNYVERSRELAQAPVIRIACTDYDPRDLVRGDYVSIQTRQEVPLELAGASLYWGEATCQRVNVYSYRNDETKQDEEYQVSNPLQPRPAPEVVEKEDGHAQELVPATVERLAVFWKKGADGLHHVCRVEVPGAVQDAPVGDEIRALMWGHLSGDYDVVREAERIVSVKQQVKLVLSFSNRSWRGMRFYVKEGTGDIRRLWVYGGEDKDKVPFNSIRRTVDIVIREKAAPVPRMLYLNGVPYPEAVEQIRNRTFKWPDAPVEPNAR
ncbi:MAG: hypothetical protein IKJ29_05965 [Akkermansia sp.]|nr:hypothetical protein [Akkermansia sp.]